MAFWGTGFVFNGVPCEAFDLMLYDINNSQDESTSFASNVTILEDVVGNRWKPYFYGVQFENKLEFDIVFGVNEPRIDERRYLDRYEIAEIASWLTGHHEYHWLSFDQDDMCGFRYNCMISDLELISYGNVQWALRATVTCDSPYAYAYPQEYTYVVHGEKDITFLNTSAVNGYYYPTIEFVPLSNTGGGSTSSSLLDDYDPYELSELETYTLGELDEWIGGDAVTNDFAIQNITDGGRTFSLSGYPHSIQRVTVDNDHCVLSNDQDINLYPYCNFQFMRLKRGYNKLKVNGYGTLKIKCAFPVNVGG